MSATDERELDDRSLGAIATDLLQNATTLIQQEVALAKVELRQSASRAGKGAGLMVGAGITGHLALMFASLGAWWALAVRIGSDGAPALGWSGLIVGVVYAIAALILNSVGRSELNKVQGLPRTTETVKKIPNAVTGNEETNR